MENANKTTEITPHSYMLDGVTYRLERLSFQQAQWMGEHVLADVELGEIDEYRLHDLVRARGHLLAAIALLPEGKTRREKSLQPWEEIAQLARLFAATLEPEALLQVGADFFFVNPPASLLAAVPGEKLRAIRTKSLALAIATGLPNASSSSATAICPNSPASSPTGDPTSASSISSDGSNIAPPSGPSLVSAGSNCHG